MEYLIRTNNLCKEYGTIQAVNNVNIVIERGKFYGIKGHSGSGKSTLLSMLGLLDSPSRGEIFVEGVEAGRLSANEKAYLRMSKFGFVFQEFFLNESLKAYENLMIPMMINPFWDKQDLKQAASCILTKLGLGDRIMHYPNELSGGEKQRVAIGRAMANSPDCILADEPTGNLDSENEIIILALLKKITEEGKAVVVVTHSQEVLKYADIVYEMESGSLQRGAIK